MKKRLLSILMAAAMAVSLLPMMPGVGVEAKAGEQACEHENWEDLQEWSDSNSLPGTPGNYILTTDVVLDTESNDAGWTVPVGETNLCLNGHSIKAVSDHSYPYGVIWVGEDESEETVLNIYDCNKATEHKGFYDSDKNGLWVPDSEGRSGESLFGGLIIGGEYPAVCAMEEGVFNFYGGTIAGSQGDFEGKGGGVSASYGGTFNMINGSITGNAVYQNVEDCGFGGGVFVGEDSKFNMSGGTIKSNYASAGGGVFVEYGGAFNVKGGTITGNTTQDAGGGVYVAKGVVMGGGDPYTCLAAGTPITLSDGTRTNIENLKIGDEVRVFDHETGALSTSKLFDLWKFPEKKGNAFTLRFTNGIDVTAVGGHCFFEKEENKYVNITYDNAREYINHNFYNADKGRFETLLGVDYLTEPVDTYIIVSEKTFNTLANGMLSNVDGLYTVLCNIFDMDENLKIDAQKKSLDIEKYGLWNYDKEHFQYVTEDTYKALNLKYLGVAIGKGLLSPEELKEAAENTLNYNTDLVRPEMLSKNSDSDGSMLMKASQVFGKARTGVFLGGTINITGNYSYESSETKKHSDNLFVWGEEPAVGFLEDDEAPTSMKIGVTLKETVVEDEVESQEYTGGTFIERGAMEGYENFFVSDNPDYIVKKHNKRLELSDEYGVFIGRESITSKNKSDVLGDGKISFDPKTNILTLDNAEIANDGDDRGRTGIRSELSNLTINLVGDNTIGLASDWGNEEIYSYAARVGISAYQEENYKYGNLTFKGNGSLTIYDYSVGIEGGNISFGTDNEAFAGKVNVYDYGMNVSCAISAYTNYDDNLEEDVDGNVYINGGTYNLTSLYSNGISAEGRATINNAKATIMAGNDERSKAYGVTGKDGVIITNSTISSKAIAGGEAAGIYSKESVTISGSSDITAEGVSDEYGFGIYGGDVGVISIADGTVKAKGSSAAIFTGLETENHMVIGSASKTMTIKNAKALISITEAARETVSESKGGLIFAGLTTAEESVDDGFITISPKKTNGYIPPVPPSTSSTSDTPQTPSGGTIGDDTGNNTTNISVNTSGGNAVIAEIPASTIDKVANTQAAGTTADLPPVKNDIVIDVSNKGNDGKDVTKVTLTKTTAENIVEALNSSTNDKENLVIITSNATVTIDAKALESIAVQAKAEAIQLVVENIQPATLNESQKAAVLELEKSSGNSNEGSNGNSERTVVQTFEAYFVSGGSRISNFNGGVITVGKIDFEIPAGKNGKNYHIYYIPENGEPVRHETWAEGGALYFRTTHFSDYAIVYDEEMENNSFITVYRLFNKVNGEHLITADANEVEYLLGTGKWSRDNDVGKAGREGTPVYRLFNRVTGAHLYTSDANEIKIQTAKKIWVYDNGGKPIFYGLPEGIAVFRLHNIKMPAVSAHINSSDEIEIGVLKNKGYVVENAGKAMFYLQ